MSDATTATRSFIGKCKPCKRAVQASTFAAASRPTERDRAGRVISPKRVSWQIVGGKLDGTTTPMAAA